MNSASKNIAIEKNRIALLRIVRFWLIVAAMFGEGRVLPRRIGLWVSDLIFKLEKAAYYLQIASGYVQPVLPVERDGLRTIFDVIQQLKRVKRALIRLRPRADNPIQYHRCNERPNFCNSLRESACRKPHIHLCACHNSRAPPCHHIERPHPKSARNKSHFFKCDNDE